MPVQVVVVRLAERRIDQIEVQVQVAAPRGNGPVAGPVVEAAVERDARGQQGRDGLALELRSRQARRDVDDAAAAIAEGDGKAAGVDPDVADDSRVDRAEDAEEVLQVIRVVEAQVVEAHQRLICRPAAQVNAAGEVLARDARQARHRADRVLADVGQRFELVRAEDRSA